MTSGFGQGFSVSLNHRPFNLSLSNQMHFAQGQLPRFVHLSLVHITYLNDALSQEHCALCAQRSPLGCTDRSVKLDCVESVSQDVVLNPRSARGKPPYECGMYQLISLQRQEPDAC